MTSTLQKLSLAAGIALSVTAINAPQAEAITLFTFEVAPDSGSLLGQTFSGDFSFDDSGLVGSGDETVALSDFNFNFLGFNYTETDAFDSLAVFFDGQFLGIEYSFDDGDVAFSFIPGFSAVNEASFAYNIASGPNQGTGFGDVDYNVVPTPALLPGLVGMGAMALRRKRESEAN
ncbi:MAG: PTPA-CTERM sorting domain-containing protein [Leptolyngbyaceae cyanobacterium SM2_5_2]|nr:PTPA-CTERM sorting domain-containing protein [Leptolyngbyaceae cyanobacterium SM2_5_2]